MTPTLISLAQSPWSEKARWALDHHRVAVRHVEYLPVLGEPALRLATRQLRGRLGVPVLLDGLHALTESIDIARWADARGTGSPLFRPEWEDAILHWEALSQAGCHAGRALATARLTPDNVQSLMPKGLRRFPRLGSAITRAALEQFKQKYRIDPRDHAAHERELERCLEALSAAVSALPAGQLCLLGEFSYADITGCALMNMMERPANLRVAAALRAAYRNDAMCERYAPLVQWRNALYERYREAVPTQRDAA